MTKWWGYREIQYSFQNERMSLFPFIHAFSDWNKAGRARTKNCYAFAADAFEPDVTLFPQTQPLRFYLPGPGTTGGIPFPCAINANLLSEGLIADGFIPAGGADCNQVLIPQGYYLIACFHSLRDFHFYRYHKKEKIWYHKPNGYDPVTPFDFSGHYIRDVRLSDRGKMNAFVGFFLSPPDRPPLDIIVEDEAGNVIWRRNARQLNQRPQTEGLSPR